MLYSEQNTSDLEKCLLVYDDNSETSDPIIFISNNQKKTTHYYLYLYVSFWIILIGILIFVMVWIYC